MRTTAAGLSNYRFHLLGFSMHDRCRIIVPLVIINARSEKWLTAQILMRTAPVIVYCISH